MHGYVDPFAHRLTRSITTDDHPDAPADPAPPEGDDGEVDEDDAG